MYSKELNSMVPSTCSVKQIGAHATLCFLQGCLLLVAVPMLVIIHEGEGRVMAQLEAVVSTAGATKRVSCMQGQQLGRSSAAGGSGAGRPRVPS